MSKRVLAILAAVEGFVILGLAGLLVGGAGSGLRLGGMGLRPFAPFHRGMMADWGWGGMAGHGLGWTGLHILAWLIPVALIALIVALVLRPETPKEPKA